MSRAVAAIAQRDELVGTRGLKVHVPRKIPGKLYGEMERGRETMTFELGKSNMNEDIYVLMQSMN